MRRPSNIVVLHGLTHFHRLNTSVQDVLALGENAHGNIVTFVNAFHPQAQALISDLSEFDLLLVTDDLLWTRAVPKWAYAEQLIRSFSKKAKKVAFFPQDEFMENRRLKSLTDSINPYIFSVCSSNAEILYSRKSLNLVRPWLTGFYDHKFFEKGALHKKPWNEKLIDVGQRVRYTPLEFGSVGSKKARMAVELGKKLKEQGFYVDISTKDNEMMDQNEWFAFLGNTKFTISRLGGASLCTNGPFASILASSVTKAIPLANWQKQYDYYRIFVRKPELSIEAISPRMFECAFFGVVQILEPTDYGFGITPWEHYIPAPNSDFELSKVSRFMRSEEAQELSIEALDFFSTNPAFNRVVRIHEMYRMLGIEISGKQVELRELGTNVQVAEHGPHNRYVQESTKWRLLLTRTAS